MRKSRITILAATGVIAALMVGGLVVGSNMGVKGNFALLGGVDQWFAPPYLNPYVDADGLLKALAPTMGGTITRFVSTNPPAFQFWNGVSGNGLPPNFLLEKGEGYQIRPGTNETVIIVGSHDPFATIPVGQRGVPTSVSCPIAPCDVPPGFTGNIDYLVSVPWHTTYQDADDMLADLPTGVGTVTRIKQVFGGSPVFEFWNGVSGNCAVGVTCTQPAFGIDLGRGYMVRILSNSSGFSPAHF
jgi:hypothetical protein